jgi:hypothetical protein
VDSDFSPNAKLDLGSGEHRGYGIGKTGQSINGGKENVFFAAAF